MSLVAALWVLASPIRTWAKGSLDALWAIDELSDGDRELLSQVARDGWPSRDPARRAQLDRLLTTSASMGGWKAAAVASALDPSAFPQSPWRYQSASALHEVLLRLRHATACEVVRDRVEEFIRSSERGERAPAPLRRDVLLSAGKGGQSCADAVWHPRELKSLLGDRALVTVVGRPTDDVRVIVSGSQERPPELFKLTEEDGYEAGSDFVFFTAVPRDAIWMVTLTGQGRAQPIVLGPQIGADGALYGFPARKACIDLQATVSPRDTIVLDGVAIHAPAADPASSNADFRPPLFFVTPEDHELRVLRQGHHALKVIAAETFTREQLEKQADARRCQAVRLDLSEHLVTEHDRAEVSGTYAILDTKVGDRCVEVGYDGGRVRALANAAMSAYGLELRDVNTWAQTARNLRNVRDLLLGLGGEAAGAPRARLDSFTRVGSGAKELARQGFGKLLSAELTCARREDGTAEYTAAVALLDLGELWDQPVDKVSGFDPETSRHHSRVTVRRDTEIGEAIRAAVARVLNHSHARTIELPDQRLDQPVELQVEVFDAGGAVLPKSRSCILAVQAAAAAHAGAAAALVLTALDSRLEPDGLLETVAVWGRRLDDDEVATACGSPPALADGDARMLSQELALPARRLTNSVAVPFHPPRSGTYLVEARIVSEPDAPRNGHDERSNLLRTRSRCVTFTQPRTKVWVDLGYHLALATAWPSARAQQVGFFRTLLGADYQLAKDGIIWVGAAAGYGQATHVASAPRSWTDLLSSSGPGPSFDAQGQLAIGWIRHSFLLGPTGALRIPFCHGLDRCSVRLRKFDWFLRGTILADVGVYAASGVPPALRSFLKDADGADFHVTVLGQTGLSFAPGGIGTYHLGAELGALGVFDAWTQPTDALLRASARSIGSGLVASGGVVFGGDFWP